MNSTLCRKRRAGPILLLISRIRRWIEAASPCQNGVVRDPLPAHHEHPGCSGNGAIPFLLPAVIAALYANALTLERDDQNDRGDGGVWRQLGGGRESGSDAWKFIAGGRPTNHQLWKQSSTGSGIG